MQKLVTLLKTAYQWLFEPPGLTEEEREDMRTW